MYTHLVSYQRNINVGVPKCSESTMLCVFFVCDFCYQDLLFWYPRKPYTECNFLRISMCLQSASQYSWKIACEDDRCCGRVCSFLR